MILTKILRWFGFGVDDKPDKDRNREVQPQFKKKKVDIHTFTKDDQPRATLLRAGRNIIKT